MMRMTSYTITKYPVLVKINDRLLNNPNSSGNGAESCKNLLIDACQGLEILVNLYLYTLRYLIDGC